MTSSLTVADLPTITALLLAVGGVLGSIVTIVRARQANIAEARRQRVAQRLDERARDLEAMKASLDARDQDYRRVSDEVREVRRVLGEVQKELGDVERSRDECERERRSLEWEIDSLKRKVARLEGNGSGDGGR